MFATTSKKTSLSKAFRITKRDLQVFAVATVMFSSIAAGAVTLTQPNNAQVAGVCSAAKYFR
jgi:hypothetical protein